jgi:uncharacterized protein
MKLREHFLLHYHRLMQIRDTPHAIAGGIAIGMVLGFTPLVSLKTVLAIFIAWLFRCSKLSAALAVQFHDILLPIWPFILRWQYVIGFFLLHHFQMPAKLTKEKLLLGSWFHWKMLVAFFRDVGWPLLLGSLVMALPLAVICYFIALKLVTRYQQKIDEETPHS